MAADFDRLTGFMEAERPCTRRTENNNGSLSRAVGLTNWIGPYQGTKATYSYSARPCAPLPIKDCLQWDSAWHKLALLKPIQGYKITRAEALVKGHPL